MLIWAILGVVALFGVLALARAGMVVIGRDGKKALAVLAGLLGLVLLLRAPLLGLLALIGAGVIWSWATRPAKAREPIDLSAARRLLGVSADASEDQIQAAYRNLMRSAHPDTGGANERAQALNAARDKLVAASRVRR
jgi:hypothetical protein